MSEQSFSAIEAMLAGDESRVSALTYENTKLKLTIQTMRRASLPLPSPPVDKRTLQYQLERSLQEQEQEKIQHELELTVLRTSLAILATELEQEKSRTTPPTQTKEHAIAQGKPTTLKSKPDETRKAISTSRRTSSGGNFTSPKPTQMRRVSSLGTASKYGRVGSIGEEETIGLGLGLPDLSRLPRPKMMDRTYSEGAYATVASRESWEEDDKSTKVRNARLGVTSTRVGGLSPVIDSLVGIFEPERRRIPSITTTASPSSDDLSSFHRQQEEEDHDSPLLPRAPLEKSNRTQSFATFENTRRNSSVTSDELSARFSSFLAASSASKNSIPVSSPLSPRTLLPELPLSPPISPVISNTALLAQLDELRNALAESEEGRLASERCLKSLKEFIVASPGSQDLALPSSPSRSARWLLPRLPSLGRKASVESLSPLPVPPVDLPSLSNNVPPRSNLTSFKSNAITRRASTSSITPQHQSNREKALPPPITTNGTPVFGGFSFSSLVRSSSPLPAEPEEEISPRMRRLDSLAPLEIVTGGFESGDTQRRRSSAIRSHRTEEEDEEEEESDYALESMISDCNTSSDGSSRPSSPHNINNMMGMDMGGRSRENEPVVWEEVELSARGETRQVMSSTQKERFNGRASTGRSNSIY